jgi:hypothetical protein
MNRSMIRFILLLAAALLVPSAVQAFSTPNMSRVASGNGSIVKVAKDPYCERQLRLCLKACKKGSGECKSLCHTDDWWCRNVGHDA